MHRATRVMTSAHPNIEDPELSITACRRADLVATTVVDISMAAVTIVVLVMVVALILQPVGENTMTTSPHTDDDRAAANSCSTTWPSPSTTYGACSRTFESNGMVDKTFERRDADAFLAIIDAMELCSIRLMATSTPRTS